MSREAKGGEDLTYRQLEDSVTSNPNESLLKSNETEMSLLRREYRESIQSFQQEKVFFRGSRVSVRRADERKFDGLLVNSSYYQSQAQAISSGDESKKTETLTKKNLPILIGHNLKGSRENMGLQKLLTTRTLYRNMDRASKEVQSFVRNVQGLTLLPGDFSHDGKKNEPLEFSSNSSSLFSASVVDTRGNFDRFENVEDLILFFEEFSQKNAEAKKNAAWVDIDTVYLGDLNETLVNLFGIHPLTIEDCVSQIVRQKLETFENYIFLVIASLHHAFYTEELSSSIKILVLNELIITVHSFPSLAMDVAKNRLKQIYNSKDIDLIENTDILHIILDSISDTDLPVLQSVSSILNYTEKTVYEMKNALDQTLLLEEITRVRRKVLKCNQILSSKKDVLVNLTCPIFMEKLRSRLHIAYFRDLYDNVCQMAQSIVSSQGILEIIESTYIAMVQINLGVESNKLNSIQQIMACVTTITIPISCITGIFGMNVPLPYQSGVNGFEDLTPFYVICAILAISSIILFVLFRRIKWI